MNWDTQVLRQLVEVLVGLVVSDVETERVRVRAQEALHIGVTRQDPELVGLERPKVLPTDLRAGFELREARTREGRGLAGRGAAYREP